MNKRLFTIALLVSAFPFFTMAENPDKILSSLNSGDFISAERVNRNGDSIVKFKLSKSGKAKFKKLNKKPVDSQVHVEIAGVSSDLKLREPIQGDSLEMGPFSGEEAAKLEMEINKKK